MIRNIHTGSAALMLMLLTVLSAGPLNGLGLTSISLAELVPYSDDTISFTAEETFIAGLSPVFSILARVEYRTYEGSGGISHALGLEVTREIGNTILAAGAEGILEENHPMTTG